LLPPGDCRRFLERRQAEDVRRVIALGAVLMIVRLGLCDENTRRIAGCDSPSMLAPILQSRGENPSHAIDDL
jgi:hypothetical protein